VGRDLLAALFSFTNVLKGGRHPAPQCAESSSIQYSRRAFSTSCGWSLSFHMQGACKPSASQRRGPEAQHIVVRHIVRNRNQDLLSDPWHYGSGKNSPPANCAIDSAVLAAQGISCGQKCHRGQSQRRCQLADAVEHLFAVVAFILRIGALMAETSVRRSWCLVVRTWMLGGKRPRVCSKTRSCTWQYSCR
jgi:hypothetical protein